MTVFLAIWALLATALAVYLMGLCQGIHDRAEHWRKRALELSRNLQNVSRSNPATPKPPTESQRRNWRSVLRWADRHGL